METDVAKLWRLSTSNREITPADRKWWIDNSWKPSKDYRDFRVSEEHGKKRRFQLSWLQLYPWLRYSPSLNAGFCLACLLVGKERSRQGQLVNSPLESFSQAARSLQRHDKVQAHCLAVQDQMHFLDIMEKGVEDVQSKLVSAHEQQVAENREKLKSIVKTILFCGRQNIALRGHREPAPTLVGLEQISTNQFQSNPGNFFALLQFRAEAGDACLQRHFHSQRAVSYTSPTIQNEIISCIGDCIRQDIVQRVKNARFFTIGADDGSDISNEEQLAIVVRYVDADGKIREDFLDFVKCDTCLTGQALGTKILEYLGRIGLNPCDLRGQAYDGAGAMAGAYNGVAAVIRNQHPKARYVHCAAYVLNLCIVGACEVQAVVNMWSTLKELFLFFDNSPRRYAELRKTINRDQPEQNREKLVNICKTRWIARHDAIAVFCNLYDSVVSTLETIAANDGGHWNAESCSKANSFRLAIGNFEFLLSMAIVRPCLAHTRPLCVLLQKKSFGHLWSLCSCGDCHKCFAADS